MKTTTSIILLVGALRMAETNSPAQGTLYFSNLGQPQAGSLSVGSDSWWAGGVLVGTNLFGYTLNSVQLTVSGTSGNPSGFKVMIYDSATSIPSIRSNIATLVGNSNPTGDGVYTYTPATSVTLYHAFLYSIVVTADTPVGMGSYGWSYGNTSPPIQNDRWTYAWTRSSANGVNWGPTSSGYLQFAINATAIPEPSALALVGLGCVLLLMRRWQNPS